MTFSQMFSRQLAGSFCSGGVQRIDILFKELEVTDNPTNP